MKSVNYDMYLQYSVKNKILNNQLLMENDVLQMKLKAYLGNKMCTCSECFYVKNLFQNKK